MIYAGLGFNRDPDNLIQQIEIYSVKELKDTRDTRQLFNNIIVFHNMILTLRHDI